MLRLSRQVREAAAHCVDALVCRERLSQGRIILVESASFVQLPAAARSSRPHHHCLGPARSAHDARGVRVLPSQQNHFVLSAVKGNVVLPASRCWRFCRVSAALPNAARCCDQSRRQNWQVHRKASQLCANCVLSETNFSHKSSPKPFLSPFVLTPLATPGVHADLSQLTEVDHASFDCAD